ncbi:hypothetical protein C4577_07015 [Candidatus Parcubacteria bacterium]|nr:MAG: hypothetical protein C4577_07015 [Candidatus Parcubacteria bacterium]
MNILDELKSSRKKPKELLSYLTEQIKKDHKLLTQFPDILKNGSSVEKGICIEVLEYISKDQPKLVEPYVNFIIGSLNDDSPKIKWESARVIGNVSSKCPNSVLKAVDKLLANTNDKSTVVRWSTAFALGEIAKHNFNIQSTLITEIEKIIKKEQNNGVKNVYLKALKLINK